MIIIVREEDAPNLPPLHFGRGATRSFATEKLRSSRAIDTRLGVIVGNLAHQLPRQTLVISQFFARWEVPIASIADEGRGVIPLVLLHNVLPMRANCQ